MATISSGRGYGRRATAIRSPIQGIRVGRTRTRIRPKLSEDALNKIRANNASKSQSDRRDVKMGALDEKIKRMKASQRLRLERH